MVPMAPGRTRLVLGVALVGLVALAGCGGKPEGGYPVKVPGTEDEWVYAESYEDFQKQRETIFGRGGISFGGRDERDTGGGGGGGGGIGVNSFLWRASLDTVSFMPVNSADPFGGVIITDWHSPYEAPSERFKMNVYILGRSLRADGIRVAVFRQILDSAGTWRDAPIPEQTSPSIEDAILTKARQLRFETLQQ